MSAFYRKIAEKISVPYRRLSIVRNPDGFLTQPAVQRSLTAETGIIFVSGSPLALRMHFELAFKNAVEARFCYLCDAPEQILPDIREEAHVASFAVTDLFPNFADKATIHKQPADVLEALYRRHIPGFVSANDLQRLIWEITVQPKAAAPSVDVPAAMAALVPDWKEFGSAVASISALVLEAIRTEKYDAVTGDLARLNDSFQSWLDASYFSTLQSSPMLAARSVNKVLPHLSFAHRSDEKVALIVVDGMAYWQYLVLKKALEEAGSKPSDSAILAWVPSITMLSRQVLFRGDNPALDYKQNPANEEKLWRAFWAAHDVAGSDIQYIYDKAPLDIYQNTKRLALVDVTLDEMMHVEGMSLDILLAATEAWARTFARKMADVLAAGFVVYITTDHGNVFSTGTGALTPVQKAHLFQDGSRGSRHLIWAEEEKAAEFLSENDASAFFGKDTWLAYRGTQSFKKPGTTSITHGGSHLLEVAIPFVKIEPNDK